MSAEGLTIAVIVNVLLVVVTVMKCKHVLKIECSSVFALYFSFKEFISWQLMATCPVFMKCLCWQLCLCMCACVCMCMDVHVCGRACVCVCQ